MFFLPPRHSSVGKTKDFRDNSQSVHSVVSIHLEQLYTVQVKC